MQMVNIHEAKTHLSRFIDGVVNHGDSFIVAKAGKPLVKVVPLEAPIAKKRLGFLAGQLKIPDNFDTMGQSEIEKMFEGVQ